jgi:oligopeptide transport system substrate-binding protein
MYSMMRWLLCLVVLAGLTGCGIGPTPSGPSKRGPAVFRLNLGTEPPELDPIRVTDLTSMNVLGQLQRGLVQFNAHNQVVPAIAQRWTLSPDGKTYRFTLDPKGTWSDGHPVTAQQFVEGWQRALNKANGSEYAFFLFDVVGAKAYFEGTLTDFTHVGVKALNAHTLQITLVHPVAFFTALLAAPVTYPARLDVIKRYGDTWTEAGHMPSNGPYVLHQWQHEEKLVLTPNPRFTSTSKPQHPVTVDMVMINDANTSVAMYEQGSLDFIETPSTLPAFEVRRLSPRPDYHSGSLHALFYLGFNTRKLPFNNKLVRRAFAMATQRGLLPQLLQAGQTPTSGWITPGLSGYNPTVGLAYNPTVAKHLLQQAGYTAQHPLPPITLGFRTMMDIQKECEIVQYSWLKTLGASVKLDNMDWKVYLNRLATDAPPVFRLSWYVDYPDSDSFMSLFTTGNGNNHTGWTNARYDRLVKQASQAQSPTQRAQLYQQAQTLLLNDEAVIVPLYAPKKGYLLNHAFTGLGVNGLNLLNLEGLRLATPTEKGAGTL